MSERLDWNAKTVAEFRANEGRAGGNFEGAPMVLLHHRGRKSGREYVNPTMYLPHDTEPDIIVFATKGGAPTNPDWYHNLTAAGDGSVERGTETYKVTVRELTGAERDRVYAEQARRYPGFAEYATKLLESAPFLCSNFLRDRHLPDDDLPLNWHPPQRGRLRCRRRADLARGDPAGHPGPGRQRLHPRSLRRHPGRLLDHHRAQPGRLRHQHHLPMDGGGAVIGDRIQVFLEIEAVLNPPPSANP